MIGYLNQRIESLTFPLQFYSTYTTLENLHWQYNYYNADDQPLKTNWIFVDLRLKNGIYDILFLLLETPASCLKKNNSTTPKSIILKNECVLFDASVAFKYLCVCAIVRICRKCTNECATKMDT